MFTVDQPSTYEEEIKKSRFIAKAVRVLSEEEAIREIAKLSLPEATHNCFAYKIGGVYRFSDDGEPGGTAGRPILSAIDGQDMDEILVLVTRFFGGIKLGSGGLIRAYGGTASKCLHIAKKLEIRPQSTLLLIAPFDAIGSIYPLFESYAATKLEQEFAEDGVYMTVLLYRDDLDRFTNDLIDVTRGRARIQDASKGKKNGTTGKLA